MKCYLVDGKGIQNLQIAERLSPSVLQDQDVLVQVQACSLNYRDLMVAKGQYHHNSESSFIPLSDMAGVVRAVGAKVTELEPGDRVLNAPFRCWPAGRLNSCWARTFVGGMGVNGVLAEQVVYPCDSLIKIPSYLDFAEASTFPIAGLTAWASLVTHGKTHPGEWVLLHGTGGVSIFAAQLAQALGARTVMTTSSPAKAEVVKRKFGVNATVDYRESDWAEQVRQITGGAGIDVVVDVVGGETLSRSLQVCTYGARVAIVGVLSGQEVTLQIRDLLKHQVHLKGVFMESTQELRAFMRAVETIHLKPIVDKVFPFQEAQEAYRYLESQKHIGKVVIQL